MYGKILLIVCLLLQGCTNAPQRRLASAEKQLSTDGETTMLYHSVLYYPDELSLRFDGYLIGVEKSPRDLVSTPQSVKVSPPSEKTLKTSTDALLNQPKLLYISHILREQAQPQSAENHTCALYNLYQRLEPAQSQLVEPCAEQNMLPMAVTQRRCQDKEVCGYDDSWDALKLLKQSMIQRLVTQANTGKPYSDIVVIVMGWNTVQEEAIRNFNSIMLNVKRSAPADFNPLVIGVTWPSQWSSSWIEPIYRLTSFPTKAGDADELGLSWLGVLIQQTLPEVKAALPQAQQAQLTTSLIGHSFGSRASNVAACFGPAIYQDHYQPPTAGIDNLINLQGAFKLTQLTDNATSTSATVFCPLVKQVALTASINDQAMSKAPGGGYAGDARSYADTCSNTNTLIRCAFADHHGNLFGVSGSARSNITYIEASSLISENAYLSGGGAHSDIYRKEHGRLIYQLMRQGKTPPLD